MRGRLGKYFREGNRKLNLVPGFALDFCCPRFFLVLAILPLTTEFSSCYSIVQRM
jgi:hypothetical protein